MQNPHSHYCKSLTQPDERREFRDHGHLDLVELGHVAIGRAELAPGWSWAEDVKPSAGTESCETEHRGACLAGSLVVRMDGGDEFTIRAGDAYVIPAGHVAWVEGESPCVLLEVGASGRAAAA